jgi:hypothetical protein
MNGYMIHDRYSIYESTAKDRLFLLRGVPQSSKYESIITTGVMGAHFVHKIRVLYVVYLVYLDPAKVQ